MDNGLFDLNGFDSNKDSDILGVNINESAIPECANKKNNDEMSIPVPAKTEISVDVYNQAIDQLQKTFREATDVFDMLKAVTPVAKTLDELQTEFTESAIDDAMFEAYENGPYYESVTDDAKSTIKDITKKLRGSIDSNLKAGGTKLYQAKSMLKVLSTDNLKAAKDTLGKRIWQIVGVIRPEKGNIKSIVDKLSTEFKDQLGEFKILYFKVSSGIFDAFKAKFKWGDSKDPAYIIVIDKKIPSELKNITETTSDESADTGDSTADKK